jgi:hypothetical protein
VGERLTIDTRSSDWQLKWDDKKLKIEAIRSILTGQTLLASLATGTIISANERVIGRRLCWKQTKKAEKKFDAIAERTKRG